MKPDRMDERLHDYLDGRLSGDELAAFERRLTENPELARTVEQYRRMGDVLSEEQPELSDAFYTRTRTAFDHSRRKLPRLLSWESMGLAAATLLAVVIFLPRFIEEGDQGWVEPMTVTAEQTVPMDDALADATSASPPPAEPKKEEKRLKQDSVAELESPPAPSVLNEEAQEAVGDLQKLSIARHDAQLTSGTPLSAGVIGPGEVRLTDTDEGWTAIQSGLRRERASADKDASATRWVLIGSRTPPFDCARISIETGADRHTIQLFTPAPGSAPASGGCALRLPLDSKQVIVLDPVDPR